MSGEIGALGDLATAGLTASVIDPPHGRGGDVHGSCANCGAVLTGNFCHQCGQSAHIHRSVAHVFEEFLHGIWHFDSKAWRTLPLLIFRPGKLTWDYVHGKRNRFIAPLALFLLSVFLMFFVFGFLGGPDINSALNNTSKADRLAEARSALADVKGEIASTQGDLDGAKADSDTKPDEIAGLERELAAKQAGLKLAQTALARVEATPDTPTSTAAPAKTWQDMVAEKARSGEFVVHSSWPSVNANIRKALLDPDFALYRIEQKAYKLSFLLIPLSLPVLWLMFCWRRDVKIYDHVVFALYSLSFMSLLFIVIALIAKFDPLAGAHAKGSDTDISGGVAGALIFAVPVHMFAQLKSGYRLGWFGALWRTFMLLVSSLITLAVFASLIVVVGLAD